MIIIKTDIHNHNVIVAYITYYFYVSFIHQLILL